MKILFVTAGVPSPIGQNYVLHLLKVLSVAHDLTLVSCDLGQSYVADSHEELNSLACVHRVPLSRKSLLLRGIRSLFSLTPVAAQGFRSDAFRSAIAAALKQSDYDLVVFEQLVTGQYVDLARGVPKLLFPVDSVSRLKWQRFHNGANPMRKLAFALDYWMTKRYENRLYSKFDGVLFVSEVDAAYATTNHQVTPSNVFVLPLAVDKNYFTPGESGPDDDLSVVFQGNMFNYINQDAVEWFYRSV